ncbi:S1 RNA-binding domain-containing protein [Sporolactobacillus pectinivorans]|uniref:CvfB family protein n=1 Tax=Sporolactobacillus pectinivorans TaxID=1591408 RepID=UPI000C26B288|nr:S1-like domain-containing RNA-binding protein [Sporolactobacillus pectinivorans]
MDELKAGTVVTLNFSHKAPFGYFLTDGEQDILLHENDAIEPVDELAPLKVFLYQDHQGRLAATMNVPDIRLGVYNWASAVSMHKKYGVFADIGINKDILLSKDDLPDEWPDWPETGDKIYCSLKLDKKDRLFAKLADESIMKVISRPANEELLNKEVNATVYRLLLEGAHFITDDGFLGFIHKNETTGRLRLGQEIHGRVTEVKENGSIDLSMHPRSYELIDRHAEAILQYMAGRGGAMPFSDKSLPEDIKKQFAISKGDFKKALGKLMKEKKLYQEDGWSYLNEIKSK